jgi:predicted flap endonuclease-1-like 5' DNA nuclease
MLMLVLQTALLIAFAFLIGCLLSAALRATLSRAEPEMAGVTAAVATGRAGIAPARASRSSHYWWSGRLEFGRVVLSGSAPSAKARSELAALAATANPSLKIDDRMVLLNGAPDGWRSAAANGVKALSDLSEGRVSLKDISLTIEGRAVSEEAYARLKRDAAASGEAGRPIDARELQPPLSAPARATPEPKRAPVAPIGLAAGRSDIAAPAPALLEHATDEQRADAVGARPTGLAGPRNGRVDALTRVRGIGPKNEAILHALGVYHFDQIAGWTDDVVAWVNAYISFPGRIEREEWISQCALLAGGGETEHSKKVDRGEAS